MKAVPHELMLKTESRSKARIMGKQLKSYLVGHEFEVFFTLTNVGSVLFPGGRITVSLEWPNGQTVQEDIQIPLLNPGETHETPHITTNALCRGFALFALHQLPTNTSERVSFRKASGEPILSGLPRSVPSFYSILAKEPEELYELWGMILAAVSLIFLVGIELIRFIIWVVASLN